MPQNQLTALDAMGGDLNSMISMDKNIREANQRQFENTLQVQTQERLQDKEQLDAQYKQFEALKPTAEAYLKSLREQGTPEAIRAYRQFTGMLKEFPNSEMMQKYGEFNSYYEPTGPAEGEYKGPLIPEVVKEFQGPGDPNGYLSEANAIKWMGKQVHIKQKNGMIVSFDAPENDGPVQEEDVLDTNGKPTGNKITGYRDAKGGLHREKLDDHWEDEQQKDPVTGKWVMGQRNKVTNEWKKKDEDKLPATIINNNMGVNAAPQFDDWQYQNAHDTGVLPQGAKGLGIAGKSGRDAWDKGYMEWSKKNGFSGADNETEHAQFKADQQNLNVQRKNLSTLKVFTDNVDKQYKRIQQIAKDVPSGDMAKILNMPYNTFMNSVIGDSRLSAYRMYIGNIETEVAKLASGAQGSSKEPSIHLQEKYENIHNRNLPVSEMLKLLQETIKDGSFRPASAQAEIDATLKRMQKYKAPKEEEARTQAIDTVKELKARAAREFPQWDEAKRRNWIKGQAKLKCISIE